MRYGDIDGYIDGTYRVISDTYIDGAYAQYKMNDNDSNTTVVDTGYGANNGTASTNTNNLDSTGKINGALEFDGSQYATASGLGTNTYSDTRGSISAWVYFTALSGGQTVIAWGDTDANNEVALKCHTDGFFFYVNIGGYVLQTQETQTALTNGVWYHVVVTQDGHYLKFYVNGVEQTQTVTTGTTPGAWLSSSTGLDNCYIAGSSHSSLGVHDFLSGRIDDLRYYKYPLTQTQVSAIYNAGSGTESAVMTAPLSSYSVAVNGDVDEEYQIYFLYHEHQAFDYLTMRFNNDSGGNYIYQSLTADGATVSAAKNTTATVVYTTAAQVYGLAGGGLCTFHIYAKSGKERIVESDIIYNIGHDGSTADPENIQQIRQFTTLWSNTTDNITSLDFSNASGKMGVGSRIVIMKKCNGGMRAGVVDVNGMYQQEPHSLYAHYKLDDTFGTTVYDSGEQQTSSGNGTASTDASNLTATGKIDRAFDFNGSSEYITITPMLSNVASDGVGTFAAWINAANVTGSKIIIGGGDGTGNDFFWLYLNADVLQFEVGDTSTQLTVSTPSSSISASTWHHIAIAQDGIEIAMYIDGVKQTLTYTTSTDKGAWFDDAGSLTSLHIGRVHYNSTYTHYFSGKIEDVRYYKHGISAQEAKWLYELGQKPAQALVTGVWEKIREWRQSPPYAWYTMEDNAASTAVVDKGTGGNNGTSSTNTTNLTTTGVVGRGFLHTGSSYVTSNTVATTVANDAVGSICMWIKGTSTGGDRYDFAFCNASNANRLGFQVVSSGAIYTSCSDSSSNNTWYIQFTSGTPNPTDWHHYALVQDGYKFKLYIDGIEKTGAGTSASGPNLAGWLSASADVTQLTIGAMRTGYGWTDNRHDDFRYYRRAISAYEVSEIYNAGVGTQKGAGAATTDYVSFTCLDGDKDVFYKVIVRGVSNGANAYIFMRPNHAYTNPARFGRMFIEANNATLSGTRLNGNSNPYEGFHVGQFSATGDLTICEGLLYAGMGPKYWLANFAGGITSSVVGLLKTQGEVYYNFEKITSLDFRLTTGNFGPDTFIELWRLNLSELS